MTDVMDDALAITDNGEDDVQPKRELHVCPYDRDGAVCAKEFDTLVKLNAHTMAVHQKTWDGKPVNRGGRKAKDDEPAATTGSKKAEPKAARAATKRTSPVLSDSTRAATYQQSLATIGLLGHLVAGRWFDNYDLDVWTNGTGPIANALNEVGEDNESIRRTCDLLLAGGTGGAYVKLILALSMVAVPIAAHHGFLPETTGQRFGAMIGVMAQPEGAAPAPGTAPPGASPGAPPPPTAGPGIPVDQWSYEDWQSILFTIPSNETAMKVMMEMAGPAMGAIGVTIPPMPGTEPMNIPTEEHRGSLGTDNGQEDSQAEPVPEGQPG